MPSMLFWPHRLRSPMKSPRCVKSQEPTRRRWRGASKAKHGSVRRHTLVQAQRLLEAPSHVTFTSWSREVSERDWPPIFLGPYASATNLTRTGHVTKWSKLFETSG